MTGATNGGGTNGANRPHIGRSLKRKEDPRFITGTGNQIFALGTCWAVTVQGSSNVVIVDNVVNDITVYGWDQSVLFKNGDPILWESPR